MFENLTGSLQKFFSKLGGRGKLTEKNIRDGIQEVRTALLEADCNLQVVRQFIDRVTEKAIGETVIRSVAPSQQIVKIVHDELVELMGPPAADIQQASVPPTVILMAGLQGSGKTTTCGKLARLLEKQGKKPLLVAADLQRPAAVEQLRVVGSSLELPVHAEDGAKDPVQVCRNGVEEARRAGRDVVILDTAGRLHIDDELMDELRRVARETRPHHVFLVCDAMTGQDAVNSARRFNEELEIDGVILTKMDGDARGGAALSIRHVTGKPIRYIGTGEKLDRLEPFHPDRMASRILDMGDVVSLVERAQEAFDQEEAARIQEKMLKDNFSLEDFRNQLRQVKRLGSLKDVLAMLPGVGSQIKDMDVDERELDQIEAMIGSMTPDERTHPEIIGASRRERIARGSGTTLHDVSMLLKQFQEMRKVMRQFSRMAGLLGKIPGMGGSPAAAMQGLDLGGLMGAPPPGKKHTRPWRGRR